MTFFLFIFSLVSFESLCPLPCSLMSLHLTTLSSTETYPTLPSTLEACPPLLDTLLKFGTTYRSISDPPIHTHTLTSFRSTHTPLITYIHRINIRCACHIFKFGLFPFNQLNNRIILFSKSGPKRAFTFKS
jgi:hypothetical protein